MSVVGIIGDPHEPFTHPMYRRFVMDTFAKHRVTKVHFAGDIADNHAISYHEHDPDGHSSGREGDLTENRIKKWYQTFPNATISIGNHDALPHRKTKTAGLSKRFVKDYNEVWNTPKWKWDFTHKIDNVLYEHGTGSSGKEAALNLAIQKRCSVVIGHIHSWAGVKWHANDFSTVFGMSVGCGIDCRAYAFEYGKMFAVRPMLGCGIVIDGEFAMFIPMLCGKGQRYNRSRAGRRKR